VVEVRERRQSGPNSNWHTLLRKEDAVAFVIEDGTGRALVKAAGAHLVLVRDGHLRSGFIDDASERAKAFLMELGNTSESLLGNASIRYEEGVLEPGEEVSVLGVATWETDSDSIGSEGNRDRGKRLILDVASEHAVTISDDPSTL
jgi:hypothetical protein